MVITALVASLAPLASAARAELISVLRFGAEIPVPTGFTTQTTDEGWVLRSPRSEGVIMVLAIEGVDVDQLEDEAWKGLTHDGMDLAIEGRPERIGRTGLRARFTGEIDGQRFQALSITRLRLGAGYGVTALALAPADRFDEVLESGVESLTRGVIFGPEKRPESVREWSAKLESTLLEQVPDFRPGSADAGVIASFELCEDGRFEHSITPDGRAARSVGHGHWSVEETDGEPTLVLEFAERSASGRGTAAVAAGPADAAESSGDAPGQAGGSPDAWRFGLSEEEGIYALDGERYRPSFARCD